MILYFQYFYYPIICLFFLINIFLVYTDIKRKKILNIYLLQLFFLGFILLGISLFFGIKYNFLTFFLNFFSIFIFAFLAYFFRFGGAGDSKYLFTLGFWILLLKKSLFDFVLNIGLIVIFWIFLQFIWYYLKIFISPQKIKEFSQLCLTQLKDNFLFFLKKQEEKDSSQIENKKVNSIINILNFISIFLIIFILFRIIRYFLIFQQYELILSAFGPEKVLLFIQENWYYISIIIFLGFYGIFFVFFPFLRNKLKIFLEKIIDFSKYKFAFTLVVFFIFLFSSIFLIINNGSLILKLIISWFGIYFFIRLIRFLLRFYLSTNEEYLIKIENLKVGDSIDLKYLKSYLGNHHIGEIYPEYEKDKTRIYTYLNLSIKNPLDESEIKELKFILSKLKELNSDFKLENIKILKDFSYGVFIFLGFVVTFWFKYNIFLYLMLIIKKLTNHI